MGTNNLNAQHLIPFPFTDNLYKTPGMTGSQSLSAGRKRETAGYHIISLSGCLLLCLTHSRYFRNGINTGGNYIIVNFSLFPGNIFNSHNAFAGSHMSQKSSTGHIPNSINTG